MSIWLECIIGMLAAIGLVCILKAIYDIIFTSYRCTDSMCELYVYGDGTQPKVEQILRTSAQIRRQYLPQLAIIFIETQEGEQEETLNYAQALCARKNIEYMK